MSLRLSIWLGHDHIMDQNFDVIIMEDQGAMTKEQILEKVLNIWTPGKTCFDKVFFKIFH